MSYELKYTMQFTDKHHAAPATWLVEIYTDGAAPGVTALTPSADAPIMLDYDNSEESKHSYIIGRKATISYVYTGAPGEPLPDVFVDVDERKNKVVIYKNGEVDGVYYVKPDAGQWDYAHAPFGVEITAVDGLAFAKGTPVVARDNGSVIYEQQPLNEFISRILYQVVDDTLPINAMCSMRPNDLVDGHNMWSDVEVHTDMFFDFIDGAKSVYDSLLMFCTSFTARIFPAKGALWFMRNNDLYDGNSIVPIVNITTGSEVAISDFERSINPDTLPAVDNDPVCSINPANKQASFKVEYKSINQLVNFDWSVFDPTPPGEFENWGTGLGLSISQASDTDGIESTYLARIGFGTADINLTQFTTNTGKGPYNPGDILQIAFRYRFWNTKKFRIKVELVTDTTVYWLDASGTWFETIGTSGFIEIARSGKKQDGNFSITSNPIPSAMPDCAVWFYIENPTEKSYHVPAEDGDIIDSELISDCVDVYPVKLGVVGFAALGRQSKITNRALYSKVLPEETFNFIDTGESRLSNTLFLSGAAINGWKSIKTGLPIQDIERKMAQAVIDGYARSVRTWEGVIYSNDIEFYNIFTIAGIPDRKFAVLRDSYDVKECRHSLLLEEVLPENAADTIYTEKDLDEN